MKPKPYVFIQEPRIQLYLRDCIEGMKQLLEPASISVVMTSPPYNIGARYQTYEDARPREEYLQWIARVAIEVQRVLDPDGSFFLNVGGTPVDPWMPWDVASRLREQFALQNVIHWIKSIAIEQRAGTDDDGVNSHIAVGHYKPITSQRFLHDCHEYIFHFSLTGEVPLDRLAIGVPYMDKTNIGRWKAADKDLRCRGNTWFIPYKTIRSRDSQRPHPATFPKQLAEMCIKLHGVAKTRLVLDPFVGLGSTAVAARDLGLPCVGFDVDQTYLDVAKSRLAGWLEDDAAVGVQLPLGETE